MEIAFKTCLPRDEASVPVVRHLFRFALERLGVAEACIADTSLALTEACTNVLKHAASDEEYEVNVKIRDRVCQIEVVDRAVHFEDATAHRPLSATDAEGGRGIYLMRALVDDLKFVIRPEDGTCVRLTKVLDARPDSVLVRLGARSSPAGSSTF